MENTEIFEKNFEELMVGGSFEDFKKDFPTLFNVILKSMLDAQVELMIDAVNPSITSEDLVRKYKPNYK